MMVDDSTTIMFASADGCEGWEDALVVEAQRASATVLRLPKERGPVIPEGVGDGALVISIAAAAREVVRIVLFLLDRLRAGIVIDCRPETPVITRRPDLRRGDILVVDEEGSRLLRSDDHGVLGEADVAALLKQLRRQKDVGE